MTEPLLTISAFARAVDLAPSTLRYYDEAGLLAPAEVDDRTGYRYYTPELERRAHMIRRMREIGVPVETMRLVLDGPPERAAEILNDVAAHAREAARRAADAVADVVSALRADAAEPASVTVSLDGPELATALRRVSHAASAESGSPLAVVVLDIDTDSLHVVATDRYWLARWSVPVAARPAAPRRLALPADDVPDLAGWLARQDSVTVSCDAAHVRFVGDDGDRALKATEDRFPAYRILLEAATTAQGRVTVDREALLSALATDETVVVVRVGHDRVTVRPHGSAEGVRLPATSAGEPIELGFSPALLHRVVSAMVGSEATMWYDAPDRAVRLLSPDQRRFTALLMPYRLDEAQR